MIKNTNRDTKYTFTYIPSNEDDKNSGCYFGEIKDGTLDGLGIISWPNNDFWMGHFSNGDKDGPGLSCSGDIVTFSTFKGWKYSGPTIIFNKKETHIILCLAENENNDVYIPFDRQAFRTIDGERDDINVTFPSSFYPQVHFNYVDRRYESFEWTNNRDSLWNKDGWTGYMSDSNYALRGIYESNKRKWIDIYSYDDKKWANGLQPYEYFDGGRYERSIFFQHTNGHNAMEFHCDAEGTFWLCIIDENNKYTYIYQIDVNGTVIFGVKNQNGEIIKQSSYSLTSTDKNESDTSDDSDSYSDEDTSNEEEVEDNTDDSSEEEQTDEEQDSEDDEQEDEEEDDEDKPDYSGIDKLSTIKWRK